MTKHYSYEDWCQYVKNDMDGSVREDVETHLYSCDQCLELYLQVLADEEADLPMIKSEHEFTDSIMSNIADLKKQSSNGEEKKSFYQTSVFHYLLATAMTLVLMGSGVFQSIIKYTDTVENQQVLGQTTPSFSEDIINKTFTWMDSFELKNKEVKE